MKSIKEKAEENLEQNKDEILCVYDRYAGFVDGANYVLDTLEKELPLEDNRNLNDYGKALVWRLKNCIEQLKK